MSLLGRLSRSFSQGRAAQSLCVFSLKYLAGRSLGSSFRPAGWPPSRSRSHSTGATDTRTSGGDTDGTKALDWTRRGGGNGGPALSRLSHLLEGELHKCASALDDLFGFEAQTIINSRLEFPSQRELEPIRLAESERAPASEPAQETLASGQTGQCPLGDHTQGPSECVARGRAARGQERTRKKCPSARLFVCA